MTNSALVHEPKCGGMGGGGLRVSANEYSCTHGAQINFGDLTPYLTFVTCQTDPPFRAEYSPTESGRAGPGPP